MRNVPEPRGGLAWDMLTSTKARLVRKFLLGGPCSTIGGWSNAMSVVVAVASVVDDMLFDFSAFSGCCELVLVFCVVRCRRVREKL